LKEYNQRRNKRIMKRERVLIMVLAALLLTSLSVPAKDGHGFTCTAREIAGTWGYSETGMIVITNPAQSNSIVAQIPYASVGKFTIDRNGNVTGARTASQGGNIITAAIEGIATVNPDCTGTLNADFYDPETHAPLGSVVKSIVFVNRATEARMIVPTPPVFYPPPNGPYKAGLVLTTDAKKLFPHGDPER
jgi:hypothetical protein